MNLHSVSDAKIIENIRSLPLNASQLGFITPDSLPVISFGDFRKAKVLTVGINPSSKEFPGNPSKDRGLRRLSNKAKNGAWIDLTKTDKWSDEEIMEIYASSSRYFDYKGMRDDHSPDWVYNPLWTEWFRFPEIALNLAGASYRNYVGTKNSQSNFVLGAHVDISPWATSPAWSKILTEIQRELRSHNSAFLTNQLLSPGLEYILVLGDAMKLLCENLGLQILKLNSREKPSGKGEASFRVFQGLEIFESGQLPTIYYCSQGPSALTPRSGDPELRRMRVEESDKRGFDKAVNLESIYTKFGRLIKTHLDTGRWDVNGE